MNPNIAHGSQTSDLIDKITQELKDVEAHLNLTPESINSTALRALYNGLVLIRNIAHEDCPSVHYLADAMHNLPVSLSNENYDLIKQHTVEAVHAVRKITRERAYAAQAGRNTNPMFEALSAT